MASVTCGVATWRTIARALYKGALDDNHITFKMIADILSYLKVYNAFEIDVNHMPSTFHYRRYSDRTTPPTYVDLLFKDLEYDRCTFCNSVSIVLNTQREFEYCNDIVYTAVYSNEQQSVTLRHLEHLALIHTPYFLLLFVDLADDKRHVLHLHRSSRLEIAQYTYNTLTSAEKIAEFDDDLAEKYLRMWWRYQDSRSRTLFNVGIPRYLECQLSERLAWTPTHDGFNDCRSKPVFQFLKTCGETPLFLTFTKRLVSSCVKSVQALARIRCA